MNQEKSIKLISVCCAVLIFVLSLILIFQFVKIANLKKKEAKLQNGLANFEQQIFEYSNEKDYISSNIYLEEYAREVLGWGKDNEIIFK